LSVRPLTPFDGMDIRTLLDAQSEVAVVGMRHPMLDEVPVAFVIPRPGQTDGLVERISETCRDALASFKQPHQVRLVEALPRSILGKVAKAELRALLRAEGEAKGHA
jgi:carnitine-CoA ligase